MKNFTLLLLLLRVVIVVEFISLEFFYYYNIKTKFKKWILIFATASILIASVYDYYISQPEEFSYIPLVIESLFFLLVIPYFFYENMRYSIEKPVYQSPSFWISIAFLLYFSGNFFQFLYSKYYTDDQFKALSNMVYDSVTIIKDLLLCIAIIVNNQQQKQVSISNIPISIDLKF